MSPNRGLLLVKNISFKYTKTASIIDDILKILDCTSKELDILL